MGYNTNPLVLRSGVRPTWLPDERFWYRVTNEKGAEFTLVDPNTGAKEPAFDHAKLAAALSTAAGTTYTAYNLPFQQFEMSSDGKSITFSAGNRSWTCDRQGARCTAAAATPASQSAGCVVSGQKESGIDSQLQPLGPRRRHRQGNAAHDRRRQGLRLRHRQRRAGRKAIGRSCSGRQIPRRSRPSSRISAASARCIWSTRRSAIRSWRPGSIRCPATTDLHDRSASSSTSTRAKVVRLKMPPDPHRSTLCDDIAAAAASGPMSSGAPDDALAFVSTSRDHKQEQICRSPMRRPARFATCSKRTSRRSSNPATAA